MTTESFLCFFRVGANGGPDDEKDFAPVYDPENAPAVPGDVGVKKKSGHMAVRMRHSTAKAPGSS